jgi:hypothetical protein
MILFAIIISLLYLPTFGLGQTSAVLAVRGVDVGVMSGESITRGPSQPLEEGDEIRTGPASVAVIAFGNGARVILGADSVVTIISLTGETSIGFQTGSLRVRAATETLRLESPVGGFNMTSLPAEAEFQLTDGRVEVRVFQGGLTPSDLDADAVVFLGSADRPSRIRRAGSIERYNSLPTYPNGWVPNIYITDPRLRYPRGRSPMRPGRGDAPPNPNRPGPRLPPSP